jgi:hypothetical protein
VKVKSEEVARVGAAPPVGPALTKGRGGAPTGSAFAPHALANRYMSDGGSCRP